MKYLALLFILTNLLISKDLLWKVENGDAKIYITGSIHYGAKDFYPLPNALDSTFSLSENLVLEINLDTMQAKAMQMMKYMMLPAGQSLKSKLDEDVYNKLMKEFEGTMMPAFQVERFKPWAAAMTLTQLKLQDQGMEAALGIDQYFFQKAKEQNKEVLQLESVESQLEVFNSLDELSNEFVLKTLESMEDQMKLLDDMVAAWKEADLEKLDEIINQDSDSEEFKKINEKLLDERNFKMMEKLEQYLQTDETYFVVVGAGHLSGKNGLINLLKEKYKTVQL